MNSPEYLAQCISDSISMIDKITELSPSERVSRILGKAYARHARILAKYIAIDPEMKAVADNATLANNARETSQKGFNLIEQWANGAIDSEKLGDMRSLAFVIVSSSSDMGQLSSTAIMAVLSAYHMGVKIGMDTKFRFQVLPSGQIRSD